MPNSKVTPMEAWPTQEEILTARILGHEPRAGSCDCGFTTKKPSGVLPKTQVANHIWMVIHTAKEARAARFGDELCQPCKGTGKDPFGWRDAKCPTCHGVGTISKISREQYLTIARDRGHEPIDIDHLSLLSIVPRLSTTGPNGKTYTCACGEDIERNNWDRHAREVAAAVLKELEEFEKELRGE